MKLDVHLNLDDAWPEGVLGLPAVDARVWGPRLRYFAPERLLAEFHQTVLTPLPPFVLYGSGDFHHLTAWLLRRVAEPVTLVAFDNHPDWDVRPPKWSCGGWIDRALKNGQATQAVVWGCGNFELRPPARWFASRFANNGRLRVHAWAERLPANSPFPVMTREDWRARFDATLQSLTGQAVYVTIDLDCLTADTAVTNWENGLFTPEDLAWAVDRLRADCRVVAGDVCGAFSPPRLERWTQRVAGWWDHPRLPPIDPAEAQRRNLRTLETLCRVGSAHHATSNDSANLVGGAHPTSG